MDHSTLTTWRDRLQKDTEVLKANLQSLTAELQRKTQQLDLVMRLLATAEPSNGVTPSVSALVSSVENGKEISPSNGVTPQAVKDCVHTILAEHARPMKIAEIHAEFLRRGYPIP